MARSKTLTAAGRKRIKASSFALPGRRYPINTLKRARNALTRVAQHGTKAERLKVQRAVARKWKSIDVTKG